MEIFSKVFPNSFRVSWTVSAASLGVREPFLAASIMVISGAAVSNTRVCILAKLQSVSLAGLNSLNCIAALSLGHLVWRVSRVSYYFFYFCLSSFVMECKNTSSVSFAIAGESF